MGLGDYKRKRNFTRTPEPEGADGDGLRFVVHLHRATRLHFDLRLEMDGVFKSWAVPKGPSPNPTEQRLAVRVEDHPMEYGEFEGMIPEGNYGAGAVVLWDEGVYLERGSKGRDDSQNAVLKGLEKGHLTLLFFGRRLKGEYALIRSDKQPKHWLMVKKRDVHAQYKPVEWDERSVRTGRTLDEVQAQADAQQAYWGQASPVSRPLPEPDEAARGKARGKGEKEHLPRKVRPMLPVAHTGSPSHEDWTELPCFDGYRVMAEADSRGARLYSKAGIDFSARFPTLVQGLKALGETVLLDGEVVVLGEDGVPDAGLLKRYRTKREGNPALYVWDILHLNGHSLRDHPLGERQRRLAELLDRKPPLQLPPSSLPPLSRIWRHRQSRYQSGTSPLWLKVDTPAEAAEGEAREELPKPRITHPDKVYWPKEGYTKRDLVNYYEAVASFILPHLKDRPESLHRHPHGISEEGFFQKDITEHVPRWVKTIPIQSGSSGRTINYLLVQNESTLLFLANYGCIEINPWFSRIPHLDRPDFLVIDLDPDGNPFEDVVKVALEVRRVLEEVGAQSWCKTSGATGLHVCVPTGTSVGFDETLAFAVRVTREVNRRLPELTSVERSPARRRGKIYLDAYQNRRSQTLASVYCLRPRPGAPASTPLHWDEVRAGLDPADFNMRTLPKRLERVGDLWKPMLTLSVNIVRCMEALPE